MTESVPLIDQLTQILTLRTDLTTSEQLILKTAISWLDQLAFKQANGPEPDLDEMDLERALEIVRHQPYRWRDWPWRVRLTVEEFECLNGTDELIDGQPCKTR